MRRSSHKTQKTRGTDAEARHQRAARSSRAPVGSERSTEEEEIVRRLVEDATRALAAPAPESIAKLNQEFMSTPLAAASALQAIGHRLQGSAMPLLDALVDAGRLDLELAAIEAIGGTKSERAVPVLASIIHGSRGSGAKEAQKAARRSLFKLKSLGIHAELPQPEAPVSIMAPKDRLTQAYMSNHDGDGGQILLAAAEGPFGRLDAFTIITHDVRGIVHFDAFDTSKKKWQQRVHGLDLERGLSLVEIPLGYFRYKVRQAIETAQAKGNPIPPGVARWRGLIVEPEESFEEHPIYREISIVEIKWNPQLLEESSKLLQTEEMVSWLLNAKDVAGYIDEMVAVREGKVTLPPWVEKEKIAAVMLRALNQFFDTEHRALYKRRLEDMSYLLLHKHRELDAKLALAAAIAFGEQAGVPSEQHPFAAGLLKHTAEMMAARDRAAESEGRRLITDISELGPFLSRQLEID